MGWAGRPGPTSAQLAASFARCRFPSLLESPLISMWALVVNFSSDWTKLLVLQDSCYTRKLHHNKILLETWFSFHSLRI
jgi:hypothetical protein